METLVAQTLIDDRTLRPEKLQLSAAVAVWTELKPDCYDERKQFSREWHKVLQKAETVTGKTGACLLDANDHIRAVEGS